MKQYKSTRKLFYNTFLYKWEIGNQCASIFRSEYDKQGRLSNAKKHLDIYTEHVKRGARITVPRFRMEIEINPDDVIDASLVYNILFKEKDTYKIRAERNSLSVYTNNTSLLDTLENTTFNSRYIQFHKPDPEIEKFLVDNTNVIVVPNPTDFPIRVTLGYKRASKGLLPFLHANPTTVAVSDNLISKLEHGIGWVSNNYINLKSEKTLLLLQMICGDNIQRVDKLVYKEDIDK